MPNSLYVVVEAFERFVGPLSRRAIFDLIWATDLSIVSSPPRETITRPFVMRPRGYKHGKICSIFLRLVLKMDFGAKERNSSICKLYFDIQLALVTIVFHSYFSLLKLVFSFVKGL